MPKKYPEHEKEKALIAAATLGTRPASRQVGIDESTIRTWIRQDPERYARIRAEAQDKWRAQASAEFEDIVDRLTGLENKAVDKLERELDALEGRDAANALKAISTSKGINTQHVHNLRGQPTEIHRHVYELATVEKAIKALEAGETVEGTAEELP